tara:strand:- start:21580 stop:21807 length:228 start_codon:yes stop_codon:yes gene_type:complete
MKELSINESNNIAGGVHFPTPIEHGGIGLTEYPSAGEVIENFESFSNAFMAYAYFRTIGAACTLEAKIKQTFFLG